jgi:hypothetical protein
VRTSITTFTVANTGFHGTTTLHFRGVVNPRGYVLVSARVADRLDKAVCGVAGCLCGESVVPVVRETGGTSGLHHPDKLPFQTSEKERESLP